MGNTLDDLETFVDQLIRRHDFDDQANSQRFLGVDMVAGEAIAQGVFVAAEQRPHEARVRAMAHFGLRKDRALRRDGDMCEQRQPGARAHGPAVDRADDRLAELPHAAEVARIGAPGVDDIGGGLTGNDAVGPMQIAPPPRRVALIHAGGKGAAGAGEHDGAHLLIMLDVIEGLVDFLDHAAADGVHRLRAIERDQSAAALFLI